MRTTIHRKVTFSRREVERALIKAAGLPENSKIENMWIESRNLADPQPVAGITVITEEHEG